MSATLTVKYVLRGLHLEPVKNQANVSVIQIDSPALDKTFQERAKAGEEQMTEEDWNKFEKDISDAFEQIP